MYDQIGAIVFWSLLVKDRLLTRCPVYYINIVDKAHYKELIIFA